MSRLTWQPLKPVFASCHQPLTRIEVKQDSNIVKQPKSCEELEVYIVVFGADEAALSGLGYGQPRLSYDLVDVNAPRCAQLERL